MQAMKVLLMLLVIILFNVRDHVDAAELTILSINKYGTGAGTVQSKSLLAPPIIDCGLKCSAYIPGPGWITFIATADSDSTFSAWSGCDTINSDNSCSVYLSAPVRRVTATFDKLQTLTVSKLGTGTGTVTSTYPASPVIDCGSSCSESYVQGTQVTLSATPDPGGIFTGWSGGCTGTDTCMLTLTDDTQVTANFDLGYAEILSSRTLYNTLGAALGGAVTGDTILSRDAVLSESIVLDNGKQITLKGGYDNSFTNVTGTTTLRGPLTINSGSTLTADKLTIQLP